MTPDPVSVLGAGPMARALARALIRSGHPTVVWNRTAARLDDVVALGARRAASASDAVRASRITLVNLVDHDAMDAVLTTIDRDALEGRLVVGLTSDAPERSRRTASLLSERGGDYLDGSVTTPATSIDEGWGRILVSGPRTAVDDARPVLEALAEVEVVGDELGAAATIDLAALDVFWTAIAGWTQAAEVAARNGIPIGAFAPHARRAVELLPPIIDTLAERAEEGRHDDPSSTVGSARASVGHILAASDAAGSPSAALADLARRLDEAIADGRGDLDLSALLPARAS